MSLDWVIETHERVQSTQDIAMAAAREGRAEGLVVQANMQESGRGRHGRVWESQEGNLFLSVLLRPECTAMDIGQLSLIAGLTLVEVIRGFVELDEADISLKWPNDVLLNGKKCAGLLLETELNASGNVGSAVLGVGVNAQSAPSDLGFALNDFAATAVPLDVLRDRFLLIMNAHYGHWLKNGFEDLRERWLSYAHTKGSPLSVKIGEQLEKGVFHDIDAQGNLRLMRDDGALKTITSGDVYVIGD